MRHNTKISEQQTSLFGEDASMCSPEAFPVSLSAWQENEKEPLTTATSGRRCCEQFGRLHPAGSWARMFSESLIGRRDWSSNRCVLIWKLKGTRCNRTYFQLAASVRRTRDTVHGSSPMLLKTPAAIDAYADRLNKKEQRFGNSGSLAQETVSGFIYRRGLLPTVQTQGLKICENGKSSPVPLSLLPTPTTMDSLPPKSDKAWAREMTVSRPGRTKPGNLRDIPLRAPNMLPTPKANDFRSGMQNRVGTTHTQQLNDTVAYQAGKTSRLNPLFVEEMMGFPTCWILMPFLRGCRRNNANAETARFAGEPNR